MSFAKEIARMMIPHALYLRLREFKQNCIIQWVKCLNLHHLERVRAKTRQGRPIRVLFVDTEVAKWKTQSLFELMQADPHYEAIVGISRRDSDVGKSSLEIQKGMQSAREFYESKGNKCVNIYDSLKGEPLDLKEFAPDVVFFQQPWYSEEMHAVQKVQKFALPCYVPYFTPGYGFVEIEAHMTFHRYLAYHFILNDAWVREYKYGVSPFFYSGKMLGLGHPMLDQLIKYESRITSLKETACVIYAPHYSISKESDNFKPILHLSTFLENGYEILRYAQSHREFMWVFKPHPLLSSALQETGAWTKEAIDNYFKAWKSIGIVSEDSDYAKLFDQASVMVTDCASFLSEFGATGKPLIHLISSRNKYVPANPSKDLFSSFYEVRNLKELNDCFKLVLEEGQDPKCEIRHAAVAKANLTGTCAAKNIMEFFAKEFRIKY